MNPILSNKTILITGGTSRLGSLLVEKATLEGAKVYLTYHQNREEAKRLEKLGAVCFSLDLSHPAATIDFAKQLKEKISNLDILIHNAAAVRDHSLSNLTEEEWDYVMAVDLKAPFLLTKELLPLLFKQEIRGKENHKTKKILMLTSRTALHGGFGVSNYSAAKAGLIGLMKSLAQELGRKKILVNAVNPGFMRSAMTRSMPPEAVEANLAASPLQNYSSPAEVADFLVYLCSDMMQQVTGQIFHFESRGVS